MSLASIFTRPRTPRDAIILDASEVAAVELNRRSGRFSLAAAARMLLPTGVLVPSFEGQNILDRDQLATALQATVESAGLTRRSRWAMLLPEGAVKTLVVTFDVAPSSRDELTDAINWKVERMVGVPANEMRISRQFIGSIKTPRFLAIAVRKAVIEEYESIIEMLGWRVGLIVPRFVGEASWLEWDQSPGDKLLIGSRGATCIAAFVRSGELALVRTIDGDPGRFADEIYRLALYYRDRLADNPDQASVSSVLLCGPIDGQCVWDTIGEALGKFPAMIRPVPDLLDANPDVEQDPALLAAAGIAAQAWSLR